jgi:hypothetical protein
MTKIATFVKGLIRRARKMGQQIFFALGGVCLPLGLYWEVEYPETPALWLTFAILGIMFWIGALLFANKKEKEEHLERQKLRKLLVDIRRELQKSNQNKN